MIGLFINVGILLGYLVSLGLREDVEDNKFYWRIVLGCPIVFPITRTLMFLIFYRFDTPVYYISHD